MCTPPQECASDASKDVIIATLQQTNKHFQDQNATLKRQREVVSGESAGRGRRDVHVPGEGATQYHTEGTDE
jgi:hypothetical protein